MTVTYNPTLLQNLNNPSTAVTQINSNLTAISSAFQQCYNTGADTMLGSVNMNNQQMINLPSPGSVNSPARLIDVTSNPTITVPTIGTIGGTLIQVTTPSNASAATAGVSVGTLYSNASNPFQLYIRTA